MNLYTYLEGSKGQGTLSENATMQGQKAILAGSTKVKDEAIFNMKSTELMTGSELNVDNSAKHFGENLTAKSNSTYTNIGVAANLVRNEQGEMVETSMDQVNFEQGAKVALSGTLRTKELNNDTTINTVHATIVADQYNETTNGRVDLKQKSLFIAEKASLAGKTSAADSSILGIREAVIEQGGELKIDQTSLDLGSKRQIKNGGIANRGLAAGSIDKKGRSIKMAQFAVEQGGQAELQGEMQTAVIDNKGKISASGANIDTDHYEGAASSTMTLANKSELKGKSANLAGKTEIKEQSTFNVDKATVVNDGHHIVDKTSVDLGGERQIKKGGKYRNGGLAAKSIDKQGRVQKMDKFAVEQGGQAGLQGQMFTSLIDNKGEVLARGANIVADHYEGDVSSKMILDRSHLAGKTAKLAGTTEVKKARRV